MASRAEQRLTRRQQKLAERGVEKFPTITNLHLELKKIVPATYNQKLAFNAYEDGLNVCLMGCAGTGKTFISMYLVLKEIADKTSNKRRLVIIRTAQPTKDIGFLPGSEKQKLEAYETAYKAICSELYHRDDAYDILKQKGIIEFHSTSFLRGTTIDDAIILIDEAQSQRYIELKTVLTRVGKDSKIVICGDIRQDDLSSERYKEISGLPTLLTVLKKMNDEEIEIINFEPEDIVRGGFVKAFIKAEYDLGLY